MLSYLSSSYSLKECSHFLDLAAFIIAFSFSSANSFSFASLSAFLFSSNRFCASFCAFKRSSLSSSLCLLSSFPQIAFVLLSVPSNAPPYLRHQLSFHALHKADCEQICNSYHSLTSFWDGVSF